MSEVLSSPHEVTRALRASLTSIRSSAFGAFKVTRALRVAYVNKEFGVRRSAPDCDRVATLTELSILTEILIKLKLTCRSGRHGRLIGMFPTRGHEGTPRIAYVDEAFGVRRLIRSVECSRMRSRGHSAHRLRR